MFPDKYTGNKIIKIILSCSVLIIWLAAAAQAESVFLKNGKIIEGSIISETDSSVTVKTEDGIRTVIPRNYVLRILFHNRYRDLRYIYKKDGSSLEGYIVDEDEENYVYRKDLQSPAEEKIPRSAVDTISIKSIRPAGYFYRGIVPGWAQIYSGNSVRGWIFAGTAIGSAGFVGYACYDFFKKKKAYDDIDSSSSREETDSKADDADKAARMGNISLYLLAGVYLCNWIDVLFLNEFTVSKTGAMLDNRDGRQIFFSVNTGIPLPEIDEKVTEFSVTMKF